jgi:hypothetical protein
MVEAYMGQVVTDAGFKIEGFDRNWRFEIYSALVNLMHFIYTNKTTSRGYRMVKICKIPIWHRRISK